jgi:hypothetical protein
MSKVPVEVNVNTLRIMGCKKTELPQHVVDYLCDLDIDGMLQVGLVIDHKWEYLGWTAQDKGQAYILRNIHTGEIVFT